MPKGEGIHHHQHVEFVKRSLPPASRPGHDCKKHINAMPHISAYLPKALLRDPKRITFFDQRNSYKKHCPLGFLEDKRKIRRET